MDFVKKCNYFIELEKQGLAKSEYRLYCPKCNQLVDTVDLFNQIPEHFTCGKCGEENSGILNTYIKFNTIEIDS